MGLCCGANQFLDQYVKSYNCTRELTQSFLDSVRGLGDKLVRHRDWFADTAVRKELFDTPRHHGIGAVITDTLAHRNVVHMELTIPSTFIRFSCQGDHESDFKRI